MQKKKSYDLVIGLFVLAGLLITAVMILKFGGMRSPVGRYEITVSFNNVGGLLVDAPVRYAGVEAGRVKDIIPWKEKAKTRRIRVVLSLDSWVTVRENDEIFITSANLFGDKLLEIRAGDSGSRRIRPGEEIKGKDFEEVMTLAQELMENIIDSKTRENIKKFAQNIRNLTDDDMQKAIKESFHNWNQVAIKMNNLFGAETEQRLNDLLARLNQGSQNFSDASKEISGFVEDHGESIARAFNELREASEGIRDFTDSASLVMAGINAGEGFLGHLMTDSEMYKDMASLIKGLEKWGLLKYHREKRKEQRELEKRMKREGKSK